VAEGEWKGGPLGGGHACIFYSREEKGGGKGREKKKSRTDVIHRMLDARG